MQHFDPTRLTHYILLLMQVGTLGGFIFGLYFLLKRSAESSLSSRIEKMLAGHDFKCNVSVSFKRKVVYITQHGTCKSTLSTAFMCEKLMTPYLDGTKAYMESIVIKRSSGDMYLYQYYTDTLSSITQQEFTYL